MTDLDRAIAAAREALAAADASLQSNAGPKAMLDDHYDACAGCADALRDLIAALDAARGEAVAWCCPQTVCDADGYPEESETPYMEWGQARPDWQGQWTPLYAAPPAAVPEGYAAAIKAVQEMMPPRDFRPSAQVWLTGNQVNELHARLDAAAMLAAERKECKV